MPIKHICMSVPLVFMWAATVPAEWQHIGPVTSVERGDRVVTLHCRDAAVRIEAVNEHVVRIRLAPDGHFGRDFSWAVTDLMPHGRLTVQADTPDELRLTTISLNIIVHRNPCRIDVRDAAGHVLVRDTAERGMAWEVAPGPGIRGPASGVGGRGSESAPNPEPRIPDSVPRAVR